MPELRQLQVFLCHALEDKPVVRKIFSKLKSEAWIDPWLDEVRLLPGVEWDISIKEAMQSAHVIIVFLSNESVLKEGYVQKEIKLALDIALGKPSNTIFVIPIRLDTCAVPISLGRYQYIDYFGTKDKKSQAYDNLLQALQRRARQIRVPIPSPNLELYRFVNIDLGTRFAYPFHIAKYPVTNFQLNRFVESNNFGNRQYWDNFPKFERSTKMMGSWGNDGSNWLNEKLKDFQSIPWVGIKGQKSVVEKIWKYKYDSKLGLQNPNHPAVGVNWYLANAYCKWLYFNWSDLPESEANPGLTPTNARLPLDDEWILAAGGDFPIYRYPWDYPENPGFLLSLFYRMPHIFKKIYWVLPPKQREKLLAREKEILERANVIQGKIMGTTPVDKYKEGASLNGVMDMSGNVWEWQANFINGRISLRGGSWRNSMYFARISYSRVDNIFYNFGWESSGNNIGFRVLANQ